MIKTACDYLAQNVADPTVWLRISMEVQFPEGIAFLSPALYKGALTSDDITHLLNDRQMRSACIQTVLSLPSIPSDLSVVVLASLDSGDHWALEWLFLDDGQPDDRVIDWLQRAVSSGRGCLAAAVFYGKRRDTAWRPSAILEGPWLTALIDYRPGSDHVREYEVTELFAYLAREFPNTLVQLVAKAIAEVDASGMNDLFPYGTWRTLRELPSADKITLWRQCESARRFLQSHLFPGDIGSLETMLDAGDLTTEDAIDISSGFGGPRVYAKLAKLLVPRGVDPVRIAAMAHVGSWTGQESDRYASLVEEFTRYSDSIDPSVAAMGRAGVVMFERSKNEALERERMERMRGFG